MKHNRGWVSGRVGKWAAAIVSLTHLLTHPLTATDLTTGYSFSSGEQNVTHTKLNNAVNNATINAGFFTDKSAATAPSTADLVLLYVSTPGAYRKMTLDNLLFSNRGIITNQTADATPALGDFILTYDISDAALKKATLQTAFFESAELIGNRTNWNTPAGDTFFLGYTAGAWSKIARTNIFQNWHLLSTSFTNLATHTAPVDQDALLIWDATAQTNKLTTLARLLTNRPVASSLTATDLFGVYSGSALKQATLTTLSNLIVPAAAFSKFTSAEYTLPGAGVMTNIAHTLTSTPQVVRWVLVCKTAELNYQINDETDLAAWNDSAAFNGFSSGGNTTNVWITRTSGSLQLQNKTTGAWGSAPTTGNWRIKCYAFYYP